MNRNPPPLDELIPHRAGMRLLDRVVEVDERAALAEAQVGPDWPTWDGRGVAVTLAVELIAQTAAAVFGWQLKDGREGEFGYLVGVKKAEFLTQSLQGGSRLTITAVHTYGSNGYRVFEGEVSASGRVLARATIQTVGPED